MADSVLKQVANLNRMTYEELRTSYVTLHGKEPPAYNRQFIISRLAYRLQEIAYGGLSEQCRERMRQALKQDGFGDKCHDSETRRKQRQERQRRDVPVAGTRLIRDWNGRRYEVIALDDGYEFEGRPYKSLTAIANAITGSHWNGRVFFGLARRESART